MRLEQMENGKPLFFVPDDFNVVVPCVVSEVFADHATAEADGVTLWIDADTLDQFHEATFSDLAAVAVGSFLDPWEIEPETVAEVARRMRTDGIRETYKAIRKALAA